MKHFRFDKAAGICIAFLFILFSLQGISADKVRNPARAGQFYPGTSRELTGMIEGFLRQAGRVDVLGDVLAIWTPHAGYEFSGQIAANAYRLIQGNTYDAVIIIGPSHYVRLQGASIGDWSAYRTPLGLVSVDTALVDEIRAGSDLVECIPSAHRHEHSIEVQIPFIQTVLPGVPIVPMVIRGDLPYGDAKKLAQSIVRTIRGRRVLLLASSDMSHFPSYRDAYDVDLRVLDRVANFDAKGLLRFNTTVLAENRPGLDCALCGPSALITVMMAAQELGARRVTVLPYANSGDVTGERHRVVGYGAAVFYREGFEENDGGERMLEEISFSDAEKRRLFQIARESVLCALSRVSIPEFSVEEPNLLLKRGVFVTLTNRGRLRGCIGHFDADFPLFRIVSQMATAAATQDYRFMYDPVSVEEMSEIEIKISVLSPLMKIDSVDEIEVGKHGIYVKYGSRGGTYLPEVAVDMGWDRIEFLEHCCVEKAGLSKDAWKKDANIYIYSSQILSDKE